MVAIGPAAEPHQGLVVDLTLIMKREAHISVCLRPSVYSPF